MCRPSISVCLRKLGRCRSTTDSSPGRIASVRFFSSRILFGFSKKILFSIIFVSFVFFFYRKRLKGCEAEVARLLDEQWRPIVLEWEIAMDDEDAPLDERRGM